jgi:hypothetical protein
MTGAAAFVVLLGLFLVRDRRLPGGWLLHDLLWCTAAALIFGRTVDEDPYLAALLLVLTAASLAGLGETRARVVRLSVRLRTIRLPVRVRTVRLPGRLRKIRFGALRLGRVASRLAAVGVLVVAFALVARSL